MVKHVFTNGCFDVLHRGHLSVLRYARELAGEDGYVIVGLNSDESVRRLKGPDRPIQDQETRCEVLLSLRYVSAVYIFESDTPQKLIEKLKPDIIVKGGDYRAEDVIGHEWSDVKIAPYLGGHSTTSIVEKLRKL